MSSSASRSTEISEKAMSSSARRSTDISENVLLKKSIWVLFAAGFERFAYYSLTGSIVTWFLQLNFSAVLSQQLQALLQSMCYFTATFGSVLADNYLGRFLVSTVTLIISSVGLTGVTLGEFFHQKWVSLISLFVVYAITAGMLKSNLLVFGADQFNDKIVEQKKQRDIYFGAYYWVANIAATGSFLIMNQIALYGMGIVTKERAFAVVFLISAISQGLACASFTVRANVFKRPSPEHSPLGVFFRISLSAVHASRNWEGIAVFGGMVVLFLASMFSVASNWANVTVSIIVGSLIILTSLILFYYGRDAKWIERAQESGHTQYSPVVIEEVKDVYRLSPYFAFNIPFWSVYNTMQTSFIQQGCQMKLKMSWLPFELAPATVSIWNSIIIILLIPIFDNFIYPYSKKFKNGKFCMTPLRRIGAGLFIAGLAMVSAIVLEYKRRDAPLLTAECTESMVDQGICDKFQLNNTVPVWSICYLPDQKIQANDFSILWQIIPYCIIGIAEILAAVTQNEFFYSQVPMHIRSVCSSANYCAVALGTLSGAVVLQICKPWLPDDLNQGNQEYSYLINLAVTYVFLALFIIVARTFEYKPGTSYMPGDEPESAASDQESQDESDVGLKSDSWKVKVISDRENSDSSQVLTCVEEKI